MLFWIGSRAQSLPRKDVRRLAEIVDGKPVAVFAEGRAWDSASGSSTLWSICVHQLPGDLLQDAEVEDEEALGVDRALDRHADPIVVAVQRLALMAAKGDEVGGGEHQIIFADLDAEAALHGGLSVSGSSHPLV